MDNGYVKLVDFGVFVQIIVIIVKWKFFIGILYWMVFEVVMCEIFKDRFYDYKVDVWFFGIILIEMVEIELFYYELNLM